MPDPSASQTVFHYFVDLAEIRAVAQQQAETGEIREQHAVDEEAGAVVNHNRRLAHLARQGDNFRDGFVGLFSPRIISTNGIRCTGLKVHSAEVFRAFQRVGQFADRNG